MNRFVTLLSATAALALAALPLSAQTDTTFTYQGSLNDQGALANGPFNLTFALFDALSGGNQVGSTIVLNGVQVTDGLLTAELDFGTSAFDNTGRWLEIAVNGNTLSPRQPITRSPYSIQTRGIVVDENNNVGIGTSTPNYPLHVESDAGRAIFGHATLNTGITYGGYFVSTSSTGRGVYGLAQANTGTNYGVRGVSQSTSGYGVYGLGNALSGTNYGVYGQSRSTSGRGVYGQTTASTGIAYGVFGTSESTSGRGVFGQATATTGFAYGGRFESNSTGGHGARGVAYATSGITFGVSGRSDSSSGRGVFGLATRTSGITYGGRFESESTSGRAVYGEATASSGVTYGGWFESDSTTGRGIFGLASANSGVNYAVVGHSNSSSGFDYWASGAGTNYGSPSSRRFKSNIVPIGDPLEKLAQLQGVYFDWDAEHGGNHDVGMIAEEVGAVMPEIVQYEENGIDAIGMDYSKMTPLLVEAVNALRSEKNRQLTEKDIEIEELRADNAALESRLTQLEVALSQLATQVTAQQGDQR